MEEGGVKNLEKLPMLFKDGPLTDLSKSELWAISPCPPASNRPDEGIAWYNTQIGFEITATKFRR